MKPCECGFETKKAEFSGGIMQKTSLSIGQAAAIIGVCVSTLRRWDLVGFFRPSHRTRGLHRRYLLETIYQKFFPEKAAEKQSQKTALYARVSGNDQKKDLLTQANRLENYGKEKGWDCVLIKDLGSGLNCRKSGLKKLVRLICSQQIGRLVLSHRDRLLRFGSELIFQICEHFGIQVLILDDPKKEDDFYQRLTAEIIEIITVSSARLYGRRSHEHRLLRQQAA